MIKIKVFSSSENPSPFFKGECIALRYYGYQTILNYVSTGRYSSSVNTWQYDNGSAHRLNY